MNPEDDSCLTQMSSYFQEMREKTTMYRIPSLLVLQLEYCDAGTLENWIMSGPTRKERCQIFSQILEAFVYLQLKDLVHGDLKLNNILLKRSNQPGVLLVKLGDFGLTLNKSFKIVATQGNPSHETRPVQRSEKEILEAIASRRLFLPPERARLETIQNSGEIVTGAKHEMDVYSLGLVWLCLLSSFKDVKGYFGAVYDAMLPPDGRQLPSGLDINLEELQLIHKMIDWDDSVRPSATDVQKFIETRNDYQQQQQPSDFGLDLAQKRDEIEQSLQLYENLCECENQDRPPILADVFRKKYNILVEILVEVLNYIHPNDELFTRAAECLNRFDHEGFKFESGDAIYWFGKFVRKCDSCIGPEVEVDSVPILKIRATLAGTKSCSNVEQEKEDGLEELQKLMESSTYQNLKVLDPLRLMIRGIVWNIKYCQGFKTDTDPDELQLILGQAEQVQNALTGEGLSPLTDHNARGVFNVIVHILTQLGRQDDAESKLLKFIPPQEEDTEENVDVDSTPDYDTLVSIYAKFLDHFKRYQEGIDLMDRMFRTHLRQGNKEKAMSALEHLAGLAYQMEEKHKNKDSGTPSEWAIEGEEMSRFHYYMMQATRLRSDVQKSGDLLLNRDEFELGPSFGRRSKSVDFVILENNADGDGPDLQAMMAEMKL